jgi:hypothetical protein
MYYVMNNYTRADHNDDSNNTTEVSENNENKYINYPNVRQNMVRGLIEACTNYSRQRIQSDYGGYIDAYQGYIGIDLQKYDYIIGIVTNAEFFNMIIDNIVGAIRNEKISRQLALINNIHVFFANFVKYFNWVYKRTHQYIERASRRIFGVGPLDKDYYRAFRIGDTRLAGKYRMILERQTKKVVYLSISRMLGAKIPTSAHDRIFEAKMKLYRSLAEIPRKINKHISRVPLIEYTPITYNNKKTFDTYYDEIPSYQENFSGHILKSHGAVNISQAFVVPDRCCVFMFAPINCIHTSTTDQLMRKVHPSIISVVLKTMHMLLRVKPSTSKEWAQLKSSVEEKFAQKSKSIFLYVPGSIIYDMLMKYGYVLETGSGHGDAKLNTLFRYLQKPPIEIDPYVFGNEQILLQGSIYQKVHNQNSFVPYNSDSGTDECMRLKDHADILRRSKLRFDARGKKYHEIILKCAMEKGTVIAPPEKEQRYFTMKKIFEVFPDEAAQEKTEVMYLVMCRTLLDIEKFRDHNKLLNAERVYDFFNTYMSDFDSLNVNELEKTDEFLIAAFYTNAEFLIFEKFRSFIGEELVDLFKRVYKTDSTTKQKNLLSVCLRLFEIFIEKSLFENDMFQTFIRAYIPQANIYTYFTRATSARTKKVFVPLNIFQTFFIFMCTKNCLLNN